MLSFTILLHLLAIITLSAATCSVNYTVVSGDTCYAIWSRYGLNSTEFYKVNPALSLSSCALSVGQTVCVRSLEDAGTCSSYGAISSGDSCSSLIQRYNPNLSLSMMLQLNSQINAGCSNLVPGQLLCFQGNLATSSSSSSRFSTSAPSSSSSRSLYSSSSSSTTGSMASSSQSSASLSNSVSTSSIGFFRSSTSGFISSSLSLSSSYSVHATPGTYSSSLGASSGSSSGRSGSSASGMSTTSNSGTASSSTSQGSSSQLSTGRSTIKGQQISSSSWVQYSSPSSPSSSSISGTLSRSSADSSTSVSTPYPTPLLLTTSGMSTSSSVSRASSNSTLSSATSSSLATSVASKLSTLTRLPSLSSVSSTASTTSNISTSVSPIPTATNLPLNFTNSLPFVCNSSYIPVLNDTCASIALNFSISVSQLRVMNPTLSCTSVQASKSLCVRDGRPGCLSFTTIGSSDTCASIAARGQIGLQALLSYNPDLNCSMLTRLESMPVCISAMPLVCSSSSRATYQVQSNDTCSSIATARNTTVQDIIELNPLADCSIVGAGTNQLCVFRDQSAGGGSEFINYQLLSVLVHAFSPSDPGLMDLYQNFMTAPTQNNSDTVMHELLTLFVTPRGQQTLLDLEQSSPLISELETAYAGKTRSDYCALTIRADPNSDAGAVNACFCGNSYPYLTCISKMWSLYNGNSASSSTVRPRRRQRDQSRKSAPRVEQSAQTKRDICETSPPWEDVWGKLDLSVEVKQDGVKASGKNQACAGIGCCIPLPGFDILCAGFSRETCASADLSAYAGALLSGSTSDAAWQEKAAQIADTTHSSIQIEICITGVEELKKFGLDLCEPIAEVDIYPIKGDIDWTVTVGFVLIYVEFDGTVHHAGFVDIGQCGDCTEDKRYCFTEIGESWFDGVSLIINLLFFKLRFDLGGGHAPSCPTNYKPPSIDSRVSRKPGKHLGAYYGNWNIWTVDGGVFTPISDGEASKLDSITYAFATVSYYTDPTGATDPGYYIDFTDWYGDIAKNIGDGCSPVDMSTVCTDATGAKKIATAPYMGAFGGSNCPVLQCNNTQGPNGGSGRSPACQTLIDVSQLPVKNGQPNLCGQMGYVLNTLRSKNTGMQALISVGGWYDSNYFAWATEPHIFLDGFVKSIEAFVTFFGWDGVDIDWEYPEWFHGGQLPPSMLYGRQSKNDANTAFLRGADYTWVQSHKPDDIKQVQCGLFNQFSYLVGGLRDSLGPNKLISIAAPSGADKYTSQTDGTNLASILCSQDPDLIINLMTYDMHGAFDNPNGMTAHQAPIDTISWYKGQGATYSVKDAVTNWMKHCDKVRVGIPFYGRAYLGVSPGLTCGLGQPFSNGPVDQQGNVVLPSYSNIISGGYSIYHDSDNHEAAYGISPSGEFVSFEDTVSLSQKLNYTLGIGSEGAFYWLAGDDPDGSLPSLMWTALQNSSSPKQSGVHCAGQSGQASSAASGLLPPTSTSQTAASTSSTTSSPGSTVVVTSSSSVVSSGHSSSSSSVQTNIQFSSSQTISSGLLPSSAAPSPSASLVDHWGTCGGQGYTGATTCVSPYTCKVISQWYSQCL